MKSTFFWVITILLLWLTSKIVIAKGTGVGVYALIDQIALDQDDRLTTTVRISGIFMIPEWMSSGEYKTPQRGYLYFRIPSGNEQSARNELNQLKAFAGTGQVVGFALYWVPNPNDPRGNPHHSLEVRVRASGDTAEPDVYPIPYPKGIVTAGDPNFDVAIAAKLQKTSN